MTIHFKNRNSDRYPFAECGASSLSMSYTENEEGFDCKRCEKTREKEKNKIAIADKRYK